MTLVIWIDHSRSWIAWFMTMAIPIVVFEIGECSSRVSEWIIKIAAGILSAITTPQVGDDYREQWLSDLPEFPGKLTKMLLTVGIVMRSVPRLWWILIGEDIPRNVFWRLAQMVIHWRHATGSSRSGVEVARLDDRLVAIRSRRSKPSVLSFTNEDFRDLIDRAKRGELDSLAS
jgi:hypothetical protein